MVVAGAGIKAPTAEFQGRAGSPVTAGGRGGGGVEASYLGLLPRTVLPPGFKQTSSALIGQDLT